MVSSVIPSLLLRAGAIGLCSSAFAAAAMLGPTDRIPHPPTLVEVTSPDGVYAFRVSSPDNWKSRRAVGELYQVTAGSPHLLWRRDLPHEFGPRFVLVGARGEVVLLDEWINVMSRYAVMVLSPTNQLVVTHRFQDVQRALDLPSAEIVRRARYGAWLASYPLLDPSGDAALVETGGKTLAIRLSDGHLSVGD